MQLNAKRTSNGFGMNPLTWSDVQAYFSLFRIVPEDAEIQLIMLLDNVFLEHYAEQAEKQKKKQSKK